MKPKSFSYIYIKHYYTSTTLSAGTSAALNTGIGSERIASTLGTRKNLGVLCEAIYGTVSAEIIAEMNNKVEKAGETIENSYTTFDKIADLDTPYLYFENENIANCGDPDPDRYASFWFHPDHLGSSNYITDMSGNISQHPCPERSRRVEYLPFGETLVEEHKNSNNSPYKFNGKELDDETGNYYYGARYYNPKWSFWLSVDPLAEKYPGWSPYNYTLLNPVKLVDPDGRSVASCDCPTPPCGDYKNFDRNRVNVFFDDRNNSYPIDKEKTPSDFFKRAFESFSNWLQSINNPFQSFSNSISKRMNRGEGLKLWFSKGHGSGGMYNIHARTGTSVDVDEFIGNAIMPSGGSPTNGLIRQLQLDAAYFSTMSKGDPFKNIFETTQSNKQKSNLIPIQIPDTNMRRLPNGVKYRVNDTAVHRKDFKRLNNKRETNQKYIDSVLHSN